MRNNLNGRLRWAVLGRTGPVLGGGGQGGVPSTGQQPDNGQGQQGTGQQGQGQPSGTDEFGDLFDNIPPAGGTDTGGDQGQQGQGQPGQQGQAGTPVTMEAIQALLAQQTQQTQAEIDRRINSAVHTIGNRARNRRGRQNQGQQGQVPPANQGQQGQGQQGAGDQGDQFDGGQQDFGQFENTMEVRETRAAFREYLGDELKAVSTEEKRLANLIGHQLIAKLDSIVDPDEAGLSVARQVSTQVKSLRDHYKNLTIQQLRRRGLLKENSQGGLGTAPGGASAPATMVPALQTQGAAGTHIAAARGLAAQYNTKAGHATPAAN